MSQETEQADVTKRGVVYRLPGMDAVTIRRDVGYSPGSEEALTMDLYYPPDSQTGVRSPAVIFVSGYSDLGAQRMLGCKLKEMASYISWGQLAAASGVVAITYANVEPARDIQTVLEYLRQNSASLEIDQNRVGLWACSGNGPLALSVLMDETHRNRLKCAVLCYAETLDLDGSTAVAEAAKKWGFVNPCAGKSVDDLPRGLPLFIARAGKDQFPEINPAMNLFLFKALKHNLPITFVNHATGPHAFDLFDDGNESREIIKQILTFMRDSLLP
jgi:hypothetical protein